MLDARVEPQPRTLPFPYNQQNFCRYEPIEKSIEAARVLVINNLLCAEKDLSPLGIKEWGDELSANLRLESKLSQMACNNITKNVERLVIKPETMTAHLSELADSVESFSPDAIVLSGTLTDFDYYNHDYLASFEKFIKETKVPVLGICGAHQLIAYSFGSNLLTLDGRKPSEIRTGRLAEFQYRYVKITNPSDPIFDGIDDKKSGIWQTYTVQGDMLRVWQNHGIQVMGFPDGFKQLGKSYLCENQMIVKCSDGQMIYTVQFHLEKSFEDWSRNPTRWEHPNESRDGRILFENFLKLALEHKGTHQQSL